MTAHDVLDLMDLLDQQGIPAWLDGGWGVDALLGTQTREHDDVDIIVAVADAPLLMAALAGRGYRLAEGGPPKGFVLRDDAGRQVDVHPVTFTAAGDGIYLMQDDREWCYSPTSFTGRGEVRGRPVHCLTAEAQVLDHTGYPSDDGDVADMRALAHRFGVSLPPEYQE